PTRSSRTCIATWKRQASTRGLTRRPGRRACGFGLWALGFGLWALGFGKGLVELRGGDAEVRGVPDHLAVAQEDRLRRFVSEAPPLRGGVGHRPVGLDREHLVRHGRLALRLDVRMQLVERFAADAAITAVLEQQDRALARLGYRGIQRLDVYQRRQGFHWEQIVSQNAAAE